LDAWTATKLLLHEPTAQLLAAAAAAADARRTAAQRDAELLAPPDPEGAHLVKSPLTPGGAEAWTLQSFGRRLGYFVWRITHGIYKSVSE
jgi:hypothetical protein